YLGKPHLPPRWRRAYRPRTHTWVTRSCRVRAGRSRLTPPRSAARLPSAARIPAALRLGQRRQRPFGHVEAVGADVAASGDEPVCRLRLDLDHVAVVRQHLAHLLRRRLRPEAKEEDGRCPRTLDREAQAGTPANSGLQLEQALADLRPAH